MKEADIAEVAIENLKNNAGITGKWKNNKLKGIDGAIELQVNGIKYVFNAEVVNELRNHQMAAIKEKATANPPLIIIAKHLFPKIKEELRHLNIAYLETSGNIYAKAGDMMVWVDAQRPLKQEKEKLNRAFTKTGLKVIFHFLLDEELINKPYREIANRTEAALGNINYIVNGLKEMGYLLMITRHRYVFNNKKDLFNKWITAYAEKLRPTLKVGTFKFLKEDDFRNWKNLPLRCEKTWWGGEPAADLLTHYLQPAELTLYTIESRKELIKNYRLIPDENGNVTVFKKFWNYNDVNDNITPPLLIYADLMQTRDRRCIETATKIYEEFLQHKY